MKHLIPLLLSATALIACEPQSSSKSDANESNGPAFASTYTPQSSSDVLLKNATLIDGVSNEERKGDLLVSGGKIGFVGSGTIPEGVTELDLDGRYVTPGIIDIHSHLGITLHPACEHMGTVTKLQAQLHPKSMQSMASGLRTLGSMRPYKAE